MKNLLLVLVASFAISCKEKAKETAQEEIATSKAPSSSKNCVLVCDETKNPDLQIVTNAEETRPLLPDGKVDSLTYFWTKYHVRTQPIRLTQNYVTTAYYAEEYGWKVGDTVNRVKLQCLNENIAAFGCSNDWNFTDAQLDALANGGLFNFDTYEKGNGNNWKFLYTDYKKEYQPELIPNLAYQDSTFCSYEEAIQAQAGDFYYTNFRFPNHDAIYKLVIKFNTQIKGCRAVKETNYDNNEKTIELKISNGVVTINK